MYLCCIVFILRIRFQKQKCPEIESYSRACHRIYINCYAIFFHPDYTVGFGISPNHALRLVGCTTGREFPAVMHDHPALKIFIELLCLLSLCRSAFISACTKDYTAGWGIWQDGFFIPYIAFTLIFLFNPFFCKIFLYFFTSFFGTLTTAFLLIPLNASAPIELSFNFSVLIMIVLILLQP